jgi:hypothetical protein
MAVSAFFMKEPEKTTALSGGEVLDPAGSKSGFFPMLKIMPWKSMLPVIIPCALIFTSIQSVVWFYADIFETAGFSVFWYGWIFAAFNIFSGIISARAGEIEKVFGVKGSQVFLALINSLGLVGLIFIHAPVAVLFCFGAQFTRGMNTVVFSDALNRRLKVEYRATALSVMSLAGRLGYSALIPFLGLAADAWGTSVGIAFLLGFSVLTLIWIFFTKETAAQPDAVSRSESSQGETVL